VATAVARYTAAAQTDRGRKRASNEDAFGYSVEHGVYLVCDGMGGAAAGEIASSVAIEEVLRVVTETLDARPNARLEAHSAPSDSQPPSLIPQIAREAVAAANQAIHSRGQRNQRLSGMGTTLVGLLAGPPDEDSRVWVLNVGDSRCYRLRQGHIEQISHDHSLVDEQVRMGRMTRAEAARSPMRNVITRALGTQSSVTPDVFEIEIEPGDLFLLCSDGLTRDLSDETLESILSTSTPGSASEPAPLEQLCTLLIQAANKAGGHDNITCLLVRVD
jgi:serine/threonine protein phosphatase PrpC